MTILSGIVASASVGGVVNDGFDAKADSTKLKSFTDTTYTLGDVVVKAQLRRTRLTGSSIVTTTKGSVLENVGTAEELLCRVPGMMKGKDGPEVVGKGTPIVYINGRRMRNENELKTLRSNDVQAVEVINNPGVQYDATVGAVVRIKTVRRQGDGLSFNVSGEMSQSLRKSSQNDKNLSFDFNVRRSSLDIFGGLGYATDISSQKSDIYQLTFGNPEYRQEGKLSCVNKNHWMPMHAGLNWQIDDKNSLGFKAEKYITTRDWGEEVLDEQFFRGSVLDDHVVANSGHTTVHRPNSFGLNTYYIGALGRLGVDFNADYYTSKGSQLITTVEDSPMKGDRIVTTLSNNKNNLLATKLVLSYPLLGGKLNFGNEEIFSRRDNDYTLELDMIPSTRSKVSEDTHAFFADYALSVAKVGYFTIGLRYEHVDYKYDDLVGSDDMTRRYDNFYPSFSWAQQFGQFQLSASYSARTVRPDFYQLNSTIRYHTRYVLQGGNASLQNQTNHNIAFNMHWKFITLTAQYVCRKNLITTWSEIYDGPGAGEGVIFAHPRNLDKPIHNAGAFVTLTPTIGPWTLNYTVGMRNQWLSLDVKDVTSPTGQRRISFSDKPLYIIVANNYFNLGRGWQLEADGDLRTRTYDGNMQTTKTYFEMSAALQKTFLRDKSLVVRFEGNDLVKTVNYDRAVDCGSHIVRQTNMLDTHRIGLQVRYSFNAARSKYKGSGAGQDARKRMNK